MTQKTPVAVGADSSKMGVVIDMFEGAVSQRGLSLETATLTFGTSAQFAQTTISTDAVILGAYCSTVLNLGAASVNTIESVMLEKRDWDKLVGHLANTPSSVTTYTINLLQATSATGRADI